MARRARNLSPWAYWRLRLDAVRDVDPLPDAPAALDAWRARARTRLDEMLAPWPEPVPLDVEVVGEDRHAGFVRRRVVFDSERFMSVPANLLVPDGRDRPGPAVLAVHGHGLDKDLLCGIDGGDARRRAQVEHDHGDYAAQLARRGFVVLAPDLRGFGERADAMIPPPGPRWADDEVVDVVYHHFACDYPLVCAVMFGEQPLTHNLWDLRRALDVLAADPLVDPSRIGCVGWSYGGTLALFLAALDDRVAGTVVSCFFSSWRAAHALPWNMCGSQVARGMLGRFEHADLAALVAPRALCVESAQDDSLFPVADARTHARRVRTAYEHLGAPDAFCHTVVPGEHRFGGDAALDFLARALAAR